MLQSIQTGNPASIVTDRMMAEELKHGKQAAAKAATKAAAKNRNRAKVRDKGGASKRTRKATKRNRKAPEWFLGIEGLTV